MLSTTAKNPGLVARRCCTLTPNLPTFAKHSRGQSTATQFYQNRQLELYASKETKRLTLRQLVFFGRSMNEERLITSANYVRTELPVRIAHRLRDLQSLPYVVVTQEGVAKVYELYWSAFEKIRRYPQVSSLSENDAFCDFLNKLLNEHATVIPSLSLGLSLSSRHMDSEHLDSFMRRMLVSRLSRRVLAEHHVALSDALAGRVCQEDVENEGGRVGIIWTALNVRGCVEKCVHWLKERATDLEDDETISPARHLSGEWPEVVIDGHLRTRFSYIREHLEYIIFELLKNSMRATLVHHASATKLPPIRATLVEGANDVIIRISDQGGGLSDAGVKSPADLLSFSHTRNSSRMDHSRLGALRSASSSPQGFKGTLDQRVEMWHGKRQGHDVSNADPETGAGVGWHPRMGIGLPLSNIFATYFGGSLELVSLDGYGTDVYLRLPKLGRNLEGIEL